MQLSSHHLTRYTYDREVRFLPHLLYLRPRENPSLVVSNFALMVQPAANVEWMRDDWDNLAASAQFIASGSTLEIKSECVVSTADTPPFDFPIRDYAQRFPFSYEPLHRFNLGIHLTPPEGGIQTALLQWLEARFPMRPTDTIGWLFALNACINRSISYRRRPEHGIQPVTTTIATGSGSCRDFASLLIECARTFGLAARFVSGYVYDPIRGNNQPGDMHAWVEVFVPGAGWKGLDPTYGIFCHHGYVPVAHAVVPESINPVQGSFLSSAPLLGTMSVEVFVRRIEVRASSEVFELAGSAKAEVGATAHFQGGENAVAGA